ncbi:MAG: zinc finger domain-containing protein [Rubripirellula sp.]
MQWIPPIAGSAPCSEPKKCRRCWRTIPSLQFPPN